MFAKLETVSIAELLQTSSMQIAISANFVHSGRLL